MLPDELAVSRVWSRLIFKVNKELSHMAVNVFYGELKSTSHDWSACAEGQKGVFILTFTWSALQLQHVSVYSPCVT